MEEIWKDIKGYEGLYQVSNLGRVKSLGNGNSNNSKRRILKTYKQKSGHLRIRLNKNGVCKKYLVHRLVYEAFNGEIPEGMVINHIDEIPWNNIIDNLMACTQKNNVNWGTATKRRTKKLCKSVLQYDSQNNFIKEYSSITEVVNTLNYNRSVISQCCSGKRKRGYGYIWKYKEAS